MPTDHITSTGTPSPRDPATPGDPETIPRPLIVLEHVTKTFPSLDTAVIAVDDVSLAIPEGTTTALTGPSGSGKSTLLHLIGALDTPDSGTITVAGQEITALGRRRLPDYRRTLGIVFQRFNLLPALTVLDNVMSPLMPRKVDFDVEERAIELLDAVGLSGREHTLATRLSGGQQQRVAIARALINDPRVILADEPTGNLDSATGQATVELLSNLVVTRGATMLLATHDTSLADRCDHRISLRDGRIVHDEPREAGNAS